MLWVVYDLTTISFGGQRKFDGPTLPIPFGSKSMLEMECFAGLEFIFPFRLQQLYCM